MKKFYKIVSLLLVLFTAPGILAYIVYQHPNWISGRTNRGQLLQPPVQLQAAYPGNKWQILYWNPQPCQQTCLQQIDDLAKMRLALGRRLYYVDLIFAHSQKNLSIALQDLLQKIAGHDSQIQEADANILGPQSAIYLVNPQHYVILAYSIDQAKKDLFQDLQKLVHDK